MDKQTQEHTGSTITKIGSSFRNFRIEHHRFLQLFLLAALIRVIVMPFFGHIDFLSECRRVFHSWDTAYLFPGSRFITSLIELINFTIIAPLFVRKELDVHDVKLGRSHRQPS